MRCTGFNCFCILVKNLDELNKISGNIQYSIHTLSSVKRHTHRCTWHKKQRQCNTQSNTWYWLYPIWHPIHTLIQHPIRLLYNAIYAIVDTQTTIVDKVPNFTLHIGARRKGGRRLHTTRQPLLYPKCKTCSGHLTKIPNIISPITTIPITPHNTMNLVSECLAL